MKEELIEALTLSLSRLEENYQVKLPLSIGIKENKNKEFGDYSSNLALIASEHIEEDPRSIAEFLVKELSKTDQVNRIEIAGPGFINFFLTQDNRTEILKIINQEKDGYGFCKEKKLKRDKILIEYVSSNPTGPLHVGHGRGAIYGSVLSSILRSSGHLVDEEYYVNDQGRQMDILTLSVWVRYLQNFDKKISFPKKCYQGEYVKILAKQLKDKNKDSFLPPEENKKELAKFLSNLMNEEKALDSVVEKAKKELDESFEKIKIFSLNSILKNIKKDLKAFGVEHNLWFKESSMFSSSNKKISAIEEVINALKKNGFIYKKDGALWFRSTHFEDEKDRVVKRENGETTYFASDIAYHADKYKRGYNKIINIWGADHHGYFPRVKAAMSALDEDAEKFEVIFIQFANLVRKGKRVSMSTRGGEFTSLKELMEEVTSEATRFFYINRKSNQHLDFDLDLAKEESKDNPLYYIQYAHARICSVFNKLNEKNRSYNEKIAKKSLENLRGEKEIEILQTLSQFPDVVERAANKYEPHLICYYLRNLASYFHGYYNSEKVLVENEEKLQARLFMLSAIKQVIFNGLTLLGISSPKSM